MPTPLKTIRRSISLPARTARRIHSLARSRRTSVNRVLVDLIEAGLEAKGREKRHYLDLLERLTSCKDAAEHKRITAELARLTFGE